MIEERCEYVRNRPNVDDDEFMDMTANDDSDGYGGYGDGSDDESSVFRTLPPGTGTGKDFGAHILYLWNKRKENMVSDFAIAGWLLSPLGKVMEDVRLGQKPSHDNAMDRILAKFYHHLKDDEMGQVLDKFWTEYNEFGTKTGVFGGHRKYIWNSDLLRKRHSAKWHAQYSVPYTEVRLLLLFCCSHILLTTLLCLPF